MGAGDLLRGWSTMPNNSGRSGSRNVDHRGHSELPGQPSMNKSQHMKQQVTIAIAVQVHDGVVLASDSASTLTDPTNPNAGVFNVYNNANKIFNLRKGLPIGGMTYGMGSIGSSSISTLAKDLRKRFSGKDKGHTSWHLDPDNFQIENVAIRAREFVFEEKFRALAIAPSPDQQLGLVVAGYSSDAQLSETWLIEIKNGSCDPPRLIFGQGITNVYAGGDPELFSRVVNGHSQKLADALLKAGVPQSGLGAALQAIQTEMVVPLIEAPMPIQDAIDFAEFLVHATVMFTRFKRGAATVGGPVESAAITKHEGFKWVRRKHYFDESLNPRTDL